MTNMFDDDVISDVEKADVFILMKESTLGSMLMYNWQALLIRKQSYRTRTRKGP